MVYNLKNYFWQNWEENRRLTLKVAHSFSDEQLLKAKPVPQMRPFARMLLEIAGLEHFFIRGLAEDIWEWVPDETTRPQIADAQEVFTILDEIKGYTSHAWPNISEKKLLTVHPSPPSFAGPDAPPLDWLQYALENEIHHRAQGYTYLRCLGVEPPMFWDRN